MIFRKINYFGLFLITLSLIGCASTKQYVPVPNQNVRVEDENKARIYVIRPASSFGAAIPMAIIDNGLLIGDTGAASYLSWERDPGDVSISGKSENTSKVEFTAKKGDVYYIEQFINMGFAIARNRLELIDEEKGKKLQAACKPPKYVPRN